MIIIWDLDYTLLDTVKFKEALSEAVTSCGPSAERYEQTYDRIVKRDGKAYDYDPDVHLEALRDDFPDEKSFAEARSRIDEVLSRTEEYLYPGSVELLKKLHGAGAKQILLTLGNEKWQEAKVKHSGLADLFDGVVATGKKKGTVIRDFAAEGEEVVVVNDNGEEMKEMMEQMPEFRYILKEGPKRFPEGLKLPTGRTIEDVERLIGLTVPETKESKEGKMSPEDGESGASPSDPVRSSRL